MNLSDSLESWNPAAATAAWLLPGLGHLLTGQRRRAAILAAGIGGLWLLGLLVGGVDAINTRRNAYWFLPQMLTAPSVAVDLTREHLMHEQVGPDDNQHRWAYEPGYGRNGELGTLFTALAGLLNLLAVIDVIYRTPAEAEVNPSGAVR